MDLKNLTVFGVANQKMQYLTERQKILATNIANANTPNYIPKDLKEPDFANVLNTTLKMNVTNSKHLTSPSMNGASVGKVYTPKPTSALTIDGNGVVLEDQINAASKTSSEYNRMITIYGKYRQMLQTANTKIGA